MPGNTTEVAQCEWRAESTGKGRGKSKVKGGVVPIERDHFFNGAGRHIVISELRRTRKKKKNRRGGLAWKNELKMATPRRLRRSPGGETTREPKHSRRGEKVKSAGREVDRPF